MKPPKFEYHAPQSMREALGLLDAHDGEARLLAGGQSLIPMLNLRLVAPRALIDLNRVRELDYIRDEGAALVVGAMTRQRSLEFSSQVRTRVPILLEGLLSVGHLPTRARGTIGGSLAHADPSAELPMLLLVLDGEAVALGTGGERRIPAQELFQSQFATCLAPKEILTEVRIPALQKNAGYAVEEIARRRGDFAIVAVAVVIIREGTRCVRARIATAGTGPVPARHRAAEQILEREDLSDDAIDAVATRTAELIEPSQDAAASADFRRHLTRVLTARALRRALQRTR